MVGVLGGWLARRTTDDTAGRLPSGITKALVVGQGCGYVCPVETLIRFSLMRVPKVRRSVETKRGVS